MEIGKGEKKRCARVSKYRCRHFHGSESYSFTLNCVDDLKFRSISPPQGSRTHFPARQDEQDPAQNVQRTEQSPGVLNKIM